MCKNNTLSIFNKFTDSLYFSVGIRESIYTKSICKTYNYHLVIIKEIFSTIFIFCKSSLISSRIYCIDFNAKIFYLRKHILEISVSFKIPGYWSVTFLLLWIYLQNIYCLLFFCFSLCISHLGSSY